MSIAYLAGQIVLDIAFFALYGYSIYQAAKAKKWVWFWAILLFLIIGGWILPAYILIILPIVFLVVKNKNEARNNCKYNHNNFSN